MPRPYSADLRRRVLHALEASPKHPEKRAEIARRFEISPSTLYLWQQQYRAEGRTEAKPHAGGPTLRADADLLAALVEEQRNRTLPELAALYQERTGAPITPSWVARLLKRRRITRKK